jgi:hypothetical protein
MVSTLKVLNFIKNVGLILLAVLVLYLIGCQRCLIVGKDNVVNYEAKASKTSQGKNCESQGLHPKGPQSLWTHKM